MPSRARALIDAVDRAVAGALSRGRDVVPARSDRRWQPTVVGPVRQATQARAELLGDVVAAARAVDADPRVLAGRDPRSDRVSVEAGRIDEVLRALAAGSATTLIGDRRWWRVLSSATARRHAGRAEVALCRALTSGPGRGAHVDHRHTVVLEIRRPDVERPDHLALTTGNQVAERIPAADAAPATIVRHGLEVPSFAPIARARPVEPVDFPVDVVYTWVDGDDPAWQARKREHTAEVAAANEQSANPSRYIDRDELRYSLRSLHLYADWVNHVWLVTDQQVPAWLDVDHPGITVVDHRDIFSDPDALPVFNSHAIESQLHHIEGLAEHFLYCNDDVHLGRWVPPEAFFLGNGMPRFYLSRHQIDLGPAGPDDPPVTAAGKVNRDLLLERFGQQVTQKLWHVPHPQRRSTLYEIEEALPAEHERTMRSRLRSPSDLSIPSALAHHYGFVTGQAVPGSGLRYRYIDLLAPDLPEFLDHLRRERDYDVFCLNDTTGTPEQLDERGRMAAELLGEYFPVPSPFERD